MIDYSKITEEEFGRRLNALPPEVRDFVSSMEFKGYVADLASAYDNDVDEDVLDAFAQVMLYAILSFIKPSELPEEMLQLTLGDKELANEMATDMSELIATLLAKDENAQVVTTPAQTYTPPIMKFSSSPETRSFIPPKSNFLKPTTPEIGGQVFNEEQKPQPAARTQVKIDFGNAPKTKSVMSSPDIHPENIIDLKDLPR